MTLARIFDPYAMALSFLVGGVGFGMTFFFNTNVQGWGMHEIGYPAMAMIYVYARNARFLETDDKLNEELLEGNTATTATADGADGKDQKLPAPPTNAPGLVLVAGGPLKAPAEGSLSVVFFFATWCANSKKCLPSILSMAARYQDEGVSFAGVTQESEDDLRYFVETCQRPLRSVTLLADEEGALTEGYQGAHRTKTIPHCYIVRGGTGDGSGVVEWHGHPTRLEQALIYILDCAAEEAEEAGASGEGGGGGATTQAKVPEAVPVD